jgi:hypothetical protein
MARGPHGLERLCPERRAGDVRCVVVIRPGYGREGHGQLLTQRGGRPEKTGLHR